MRSNLLSLQNTVTLLNRTQERLSTGKKVNSAIDNPVSYFASQNLTSRASKIDGLKDSMGQAIQTVTAADKGITAITTMIEQAKGIAQTAQTAENDQDSLSVQLTDITNTGGADTIAMGDVTFTATTADAATDFDAGATQAEAATNLAAAINAYDWSAETYTFSATVSGDTLTLTKVDNATGMNKDVAADDVTPTNTTTVETVNTATSELESLQSQYNDLRDQLTALAEDSGYKGINLLKGDTLTVKFESTSMDVAGFSASADSLGITAAAWATDADNVDGDLTKLDAALDTLSQKASMMAGNLSIITVRQEFSTSMINVLTEGSDNLVLADTNEEGANMLMLQTRQSLATTALSLSSQAAQSVLQLFS
jgi:flagellin-like hook-associated protein FlgL